MNHEQIKDMFCSVMFYFIIIILPTLKKKKSTIQITDTYTVSKYNQLRVNTQITHLIKHGN